jgi:hypothetical protein
MSHRKLIRLFLVTALSAGLLTFLVRRISFERLRFAATELNWRLLIPLTVLMVLLLYVWDAVCLPLVYRVSEQRWGFWRSLHIRGSSYLGGAINYELGQAVLAWSAARMQRTSLVRMLSRSVVLAYHDFVVLLAMGLFGAMFADEPRIVRIRLAIATALGIALALAACFWLLPKIVGPRWRNERVHLLFDGWDLKKSLQLAPMRAVYFGILIVYAALALRICGLEVDRHVVASSIPLVMLADALPSLAGLGTRDASLQLLLNPKDPAVLLALSLIWSAGMMIVRSLIGLAHLWAAQLTGGFPGNIFPEETQLTECDKATRAS